MRQWERGPGRPISEPFPFSDHRTLAQVARDEREAELADILARAKRFDRTSFINPTPTEG